jgi:hypothetical protein
VCSSDLCTNLAASAGALRRKSTLLNCENAAEERSNEVTIKAVNRLVVGWLIFLLVSSVYLTNIEKS